MLALLKAVRGNAKERDNPTIECLSSDFTVITCQSLLYQVFRHLNSRRKTCTKALWMPLLFVTQYIVKNTMLLFLQRPFHFTIMSDRYDHINNRKSPLDINFCRL